MGHAHKLQQLLTSVCDECHCIEKRLYFHVLSNASLIKYSTSLLDKFVKSNKHNKQHPLWANGGRAFVRTNWFDVNTTGSLLYCILGNNVRAGCQWTQTGNCGLWHLGFCMFTSKLNKSCWSMSEIAWRELGNECMSSVSMTTMDVIPGKCINLWL